jgi:hypothetical protein
MKAAFSWSPVFKIHKLTNYGKESERVVRIWKDTRHLVPAELFAVSRLTVAKLMLNA